MIRIGSLELGTGLLVAAPFTDLDVRDISFIEDIDIVELRIDMFEDISISGIEETCKKARNKFKLPIIVTVRSRHEGGIKDIDNDTRLEIFRKTTDFADAADIELSSEIAAEVVSMSRKAGNNAIVSYHNFHSTPPVNELSDILNDAISIGADITKVAVMPETAGDLRIITQFTLNHWDKGVVTIAMGRTGMLSRAYLPMIGSLFTFASLKTTSAPGQPSVGELKKNFFKVGD